MKDLNKSIVSLLLASSLVGSVAPSMASANGVEETEEYSNYYYDREEKTVKVYHMNGIYSTLVNQEPVYVYIGNSLVNEVMPKNDALILMGQTFKDTYLMKKTVNNNTVYAVSDRPDVYGWTNIRKSSVGPETQVATTIELGEFLLRGVDLSDYEYNSLGFGEVDINNDGIAENVFLGNGKYNVNYTRDEAIRYAKLEGLYYQSKRITDPIRNKRITVYSLSEKSYVPGWERISKTELPRTAKVASNTEYADAVYDIAWNMNSLRVENVTIQTGLKPSTPTETTYNRMLKNDALDYLANNQLFLCVLGKSIVNPNTGKKEVMYAFSFDDYVEGWTIIGNDFIPENAYIFLTMEDAYIYEDSLNRGYSRGLRR